MTACPTTKEEATRRACDGGPFCTHLVKTHAHMGSMGGREYNRTWLQRLACALGLHARHPLREIVSAETEEAPSGWVVVRQESRDIGFVCWRPGCDWEKRTS